MADLENWQGCEPPGRLDVTGEFVRVRRLDMENDLPGLFQALCGPANDDLWRFIPIGPFADEAGLRKALLTGRDQAGWVTCVFVDPASDALLGMASYMRIRPEHGSAEVGCVGDT